MSATEHFIEQESIDGRREPTNKLIIKMRKRGVKRWLKYRSKGIIMASGILGVLVAIGFLINFAAFTEETDESKYGSE